MYNNGFAIFLVVLLVCRNGESFSQTNLWPYSLVLYKFDTSFDDPVKRHKVLGDFRLLEALTCVRFVAVNGNENAPTYALIRSGVYCSSQVGRQLNSADKAQQVSMPYWCVEKQGAVLHELLHLLGFGHEQSRPDRDRFVSVERSNIETNKLFTYERRADARLLTNAFHLPYDFDSILHYGPYDFGLDKNRPTLRSTRAPFTVHANTQLSPLDVIKVNAAYGCRSELRHWQMSCVDFLRECRRVSAEQCANSAYVRVVCAKKCAACDDAAARSFLFASR